MTTINGELLQNRFQDSSISVTNAEICLDGGIDLLNTFGAGLDNLTGAAGSKTGTYTSKQAGAIMVMAQQIYSKHYKNASGTSNATLGPAGIGYTSDNMLLTMAETLAEKIKGGASLAFVVGDDTSGLT